MRRIIRARCQDYVYHSRGDTSKAGSTTAETRTSTDDAGIARVMAYERAKGRRAMELGGDGSAAATAELVAFLADEDASIHWLAGSSLAQRAGAAGVVAAMAAFVRRAEAAREEMRRVLEMIRDAAKDEALREAARSVLAELVDA